MKWLNLLIVAVSGLVTGLVFRRAYGCIRYIRKMDEEELTCNTCEQKDGCIAMKSIGSSNWVTEFTYTTYLLMQKKCTYAQAQKPAYMIPFAILNSALYVVLYLVYGWSVDFVTYALSTTALIYVGLIDWNTQYIPAEFNLIIFILGLIRLCVRPEHWVEQVVGLFAVSVFLLLIDLVGTKIRHGDHVMGGGDIKLMAAAGLLIGWKLNIVAFMMGCVCGSILHLIIMKIGGREHKLAFGPYLALGIYLAMICGEQLVGWYLGIMGL